MTLISPAAGRITSGFGPRKTGIPGASTNHVGVDIAPPVRGQKAPVTVHAPAYGEVIEVGIVGDNVQEYRGEYVRLRRTNGDVLLVQHLSRVRVRKGQTVRIGTPLGTMSDTGVASGIHLHYEVHVKGVPVDPAAYYKRHGATLGAHPGAGRYTVTIPADTELIVRGGPTAKNTVLHRRPRGFKVTALAVIGKHVVTKAGRYYLLSNLKKG